MCYSYVTICKVVAKIQLFILFHQSNRIISLVWKFPSFSGIQLWKSRRIVIECHLVVKTRYIPH